MIRKIKLTRIGLWSVVKIGFFLSAAAGFLLGLFLGILFAMVSSLVAMAAHSRLPGMGPGALIVLPGFFSLFCGFLGAAASFLAALVYNLAAGLAGGLEIEADFREDMERTEGKAVPLTAQVPPAGGVVADRRPVHIRSSFRSPSERPRTLGLRRARKRGR